MVKNMENSLQNGCSVSFKTATGDFTTTTNLQSQTLELVTIVTVINVVTSVFGGEDLK